MPAMQLLGRRTREDQRGGVWMCLVVNEDILDVGAREVLEVYQENPLCRAMSIR